MLFDEAIIKCNSWTHIHFAHEVQAYAWIFIILLFLESEINLKTE